MSAYDSLDVLLTDLLAELGIRGILPARGAPLTELLALRLAAPDRTPEALQASRDRALYERVSPLRQGLCGPGLRRHDRPLLGLQARALLRRQVREGRLAAPQARVQDLASRGGCGD
jgi:hypothetical protein